MVQPQSIMEEPQRSAKRFFGYPRAVEGPHVPYNKKKDENPVLSGILLVACAWLLCKFQFIQKFFWSNAGFSSLRTIKDLSSYTERWDPTVIPVSTGESPSPKLDSKSFLMLPEQLPGRYRSATEYHAMYLSGQITPLAVAESLLPLICRDVSKASHHSIAFIDSHPDEIIKAATESTIRYQSGAPFSILDGVPAVVKDEVDLAGYRTTQGRKKNEKIFPIAKESIWPIQKWEDAGVLIMGKANLHEIGADTTNNNSNWGTPRNPHNNEYYPGGSSGGSAYAVSAGLVPFALGTDGGGSIRIPASFCGIYGLKTSHSRLGENGSTVTVYGPLAASMSDLGIAYRIMAIPNPTDPSSSLFIPPGVVSSRPKILGIYQEWFNRADPDVLKLCTQAVDFYKNKLGYEVVQIEIPYIPEGQIAHAFTILCEMAMGIRMKPASESNWLADLNPANQVLLGVADQTPARDYLLAQQMRNLLMQHLAFLFQKYPGLVIVTPTTALPGWPIGHEGHLKHGISDGNKSLRNMEYVWLANFSGCPAISCPVGYVDPAKGHGKIPVGLMAMGEWGSEDTLIEWGKDAEKWLNEEYPGGRQRPGNWEDVAGFAKEKMRIR